MIEVYQNKMFKSFKKINQKGNVATPVLVWLVLGLFILVVVSKTENENKKLPKISSDQIVNQQQSPIRPNPTIDPEVLTDTVKQFYSSISSRQFDPAWKLLSKSFQNNAKTYDSFVKGYDTTKSVSIQDIHIKDMSDNSVFIKLQSTDSNHDQIQTKDYSGTWKLIKEDGSWKLDTADIALLSVSPSSRALNVAAFVYAYSSPAEIEDWRIKHGIKKSNNTQEIHEQALWMDQHPDVLALNESRIKQYVGSYQNNQTAEGSELSTPEPTPKSAEFGQASMYQKVGNTLYGNDGSNYMQVGDTTRGNNGANYNSVGDYTYGSDGTSYIKSGDTTFGNNGSVCFDRGTWIQCVGGN